MMKFFRKYNKHLLAVFMALLLVIWLGGDALTYFLRPGPGHRLIGTSNLGDITAADVQHASYLAELQRLVGLDWQRFANRRTAGGEQFNEIDWVLLQREAKHYGVSVSPAQAQRMLAERGLPERYVQALALRRDITAEQIYAAAAQYLSVEKMLNLFGSAMRVPETELRLYAKDNDERAKVRMVVLPAKSFANPDETFTEEEMQKQFEEYRDKRSGSGLDFGYYLEPRVEIQYIEIKPEVIKGELRGGEEEWAREALHYWQKNRENPRFRRPEPATTQPASQPATSQPATQPAEAEATSQPSEFYDTFAEARSEAVDIIKARQAGVEAGRIAAEIGQELAEPWFDVPANTNGFKPAPKKVSSLEYYSKVVDQLPARLSYEGAIDVGTIGWITQKELSQRHEGIAATGMSMPDGTQIPFSALAFLVQGIAKPAKDSPNAALYLSHWQTFPVALKGRQDNLYLFRVVGAIPGHAPDSLDEVREKVVADLRLQQGMEKAKETADAFTASVGTSGLKAAWQANTDLVDRVAPDQGGYREPPAFPRSMFGRPPFVVGLGIPSEEFLDTAFKLAASGDESQVKVVEVPALAKVVVLQGVKIDPVYQSRYETLRASIRQQLMQTRGAQLVYDYLDPEQIRARTGFKRAKNA